MARDEVLRSGQVTLERDAKIYSARYDVLNGGMVRLETGRTTQIGGSTAEDVARMLLHEIITSGAADGKAWAEQRADVDSRARRRLMNGAEEADPAVLPAIPSWAPATFRSRRGGLLNCWKGDGALPEALSF
jgi:hypothetical protein